MNINRLKNKKIAFLIALIILLLVPAGIYIVNATRPVEAPEEKYAPITDTAKVEDELIVKFNVGYTPDDLRELVNQREVNSQSAFGRIINARQDAQNAITATPSPEERLMELEELFASLGVTGTEKLLDSESEEINKFYILRFPEGSDLELKQEQLAKSHAIDYIEPNYYAEIFQATPNDPLYQDLWGMQKINISEVWSITTGSKDIKVAVVDTGVSLNHSDLAGNITSGGRDFVNNDNNPDDDLFHGTHVAGTIAAIGNNSTGVTGANWNASILPIKVCNSQGRCDTADVASGIAYAADQGSDIINMSLGGPNPCNTSQAYRDATEYAQDKGSVVIAAAGNDNANAGGYSPASCPGVITVGATDRNDNASSFSNYGSVVDIAAPGGTQCSASTCTAQNAILSTFPGNGYSSIPGTSMSAPHVAGVAALMKSVDSSLTSAQIENCLVQGADNINTSKDVGPRLNAKGAFDACNLSSSQPTATPTTSQTTPTVTPTDAPQTTITPGQLKYSVGGIVFRDSNQNKLVDQGESPIPGASLLLTGPAGTFTEISDQNGEFFFPDLTKGSYTLTQSYENIPYWEFNFDITDTRYSYYFRIQFVGPEGAEDNPNNPSDPSDPAPTPIGGDNSDSDQETNPSGTPTPTPTPLYFFDCREVEGTRQGPNGPIKFSYLVCEPNNKFYQP